MNEWVLLVLVSVFAFLLTYFQRWYALKSSLLDLPNERSSHSVPTPRGGGVAIVASFMAANVCVMLTSQSNSLNGLALLGAGCFVALVGFWDDHGHVSARWRLLVHFLAAFWALYWLGGVPTLQFLGMQSDLGWVGLALVSVYLVWMINLYNFMDGIDGIASLEAICVCLGGALLYVLSGNSAMALLPLILASAVLGFLFWNFPPARIFMGDAGSGFLGVMLGIMSIQAAWVDPALFWSWVILLGVFIVDGTFTLIRRLLLGEKVYEAHRTHAYQYASRQFGRHFPVTIGVGMINLIWLLPMALFTGLGYVDGVFALALAFTPLILLAVKFRAGMPE